MPFVLQRRSHGPSLPCGSVAASQATSLESFEAQHKVNVAGVDGDFEIDVSVRFTVFGGARFHVLAECKRHSHPIKRDVVQILNDRLRSTGAHKGFVFATAAFQSGAIEYAAKKRNRPGANCQWAHHLHPGDMGASSSVAARGSEVCRLAP